jgi:hypothetical protein
MAHRAAVTISRGFALQQRAQMERGVRFAALVRALVARLRLVQLAAFFEQQAEIER